MLKFLQQLLRVLIQLDIRGIKHRQIVSKYIMKRFNKSIIKTKIRLDYQTLRFLRGLDLWKSLFKYQRKSAKADFNFEFSYLFSNGLGKKSYTAFFKHLWHVLYHFTKRSLYVIDGISSLFNTCIPGNKASWSLCILLPWVSPTDL